MLLDNWVIVENNSTKDGYKTYNTHIISSPLPKEDVNDWQPLFVFIIMLRGWNLEAQKVQSAELWNYTQKSDLGFNKKFAVVELQDTSDLQL